MMAPSSTSLAALALAAAGAVNKPQPDMAMRTKPLLAFLNLIPRPRGVGAAMLTSVSVIWLIVGPAAQDAPSSVVADVAMLPYRPFQVGDWIQADGHKGPETGVVEPLALGYTAIRTGGKRRGMIPNSQMAGQSTINLGEAPRFIGSQALEDPS